MHVLEDVDDKDSILGKVDKKKLQPIFIQYQKKKLVPIQDMGHLLQMMPLNHNMVLQL
jgi:hypothetical protein